MHSLNRIATLKSATHHLYAEQESGPIGCRMPIYEDLFPDSEHKTRSLSDLPLLSSIENQREIMFNGYNTPHSLIRAL
jgi:hypothetical protein